MAEERDDPISSSRKLELDMARQRMAKYYLAESVSEVD